LLKNLLISYSKLHDEGWLKIYPIPSFRGDVSASIKIGPVRNTTLDFFYEIIPLGINLVELQHLPRFSRIVQSLDTPSYERISTIFEVRIAATYKGAGFTVELEPQNGKGGRCDLRIDMSKNLKNWLYIECKTQNSDSQVIQSHKKLIDDLSNQIYSKVKNFLNNQHRVEVQLPTPYSMPLKKRNSLLKNIELTITKREFGQWKECYSIKYRISEIKDPPDIPVNHMYGGLVITRGNIGVSLMEPTVHITCPLGNVIRNALNLVTDARKQLPDHFRGLIALKIFNGHIILNHMNKRIQQAEYDNVTAIIVIDNNYLFPIRNRLHNDISDAVLSIPSSLFH
jgi:hypothetical protein